MKKRKVHLAEAEIEVGESVALPADYVGEGGHHQQGLHCHVAS